MTLWTAVLVASLLCFALKALGYLIPPRWFAAPAPSRIIDLLTVARRLWRHEGDCRLTSLEALRLSGYAARVAEMLEQDRARIQVGRISNFGLLEMSRQRRRSGIVDGTTHSCPTCAGAGVVRTHEMAGLRILRAIESAALTDRSAVIAVKASLEVTLYILNHKRDWLKRIEDDYAVTVEIVADSAKAGDQYELEKRGAPRELPAAPAFIRPDQFEVSAEEDAEVETGETEDSDERAAASEEGAEGSDSGQGGKRRRRRRRKRRDGSASPQQAEGRNDASPEDMSGEDEEGESDNDDANAPREGASADSGGEEGGDGQRRRRRRGRRGGRRNNRRPDQAADGETVETGDDASASFEQSHADDDEQPVIDDAGAFAPESSEAELAQGEAGDDAEAPAAEPETATPAPIAAANDQTAPETPVAAPAITETAAKPQPAENKPARKGWWQKAIGG